MSDVAALEVEELEKHYKLLVEGEFRYCCG
jgi:hypothetical protein